MEVRKSTVIKEHGNRIETKIIGSSELYLIVRNEHIILNFSIGMEAYLFPCILKSTMKSQRVELMAPLKAMFNLLISMFSTNVIKLGNYYNYERILNNMGQWQSLPATLGHCHFNYEFLSMLHIRGSVYLSGL